MRTHTLYLVLSFCLSFFLSFLFCSFSLSPSLSLSLSLSLPLPLALSLSLYIYVFHTWLARQQVQEKHPLLNVLNDRVTFTAEGFCRRVSVPRDAATLSEAAEKLAPLAKAHDAIHLELASLNRNVLSFVWGPCQCT